MLKNKQTSSWISLYFLLIWGRVGMESEAGRVLIAGAVEKVNRTTIAKPNIHAEYWTGGHMAGQHRCSSPEHRNVVGRKLLSYR
jgi:hypothetical protein